MIDLSLRQVYASRWQKDSGMFRIYILEQLLVVFDICIYVSSSIRVGIKYNVILFKIVWFLFIHIMLLRIIWAHEFGNMISDYEVI